jgi:transcriptional regulator with XRE-family HTH domain
VTNSSAHESFSTGEPGRDLRTLREVAGLTRAELAIAADCSPAMLQLIEAGAVPKRSRVLARARLVLAELEIAARDSGRADS